MNKIYSNVYTEVYEILENLPIEYLKKLPNELINLFVEKRNKEYKFEYNKEKGLNEQEISVEAKAIISNLYRDYWVDEEEKKEILENQNKQRMEYEEKQREKYNPDELFKKKQSESEIIIDKKEESMIIQKESIFTKLINKIKSIFKK